MNTPQGKTIEDAIDIIDQEISFYMGYSEKQKWDTLPQIPQRDAFKQPNPYHNERLWGMWQARQALTKITRKDK